METLANKSLSQQTADLQNAYVGLDSIQQTTSGINISGSVAFTLCPDGFESITDSFKLSIHVPENYPIALPEVIETSGDIDHEFHHMNVDNTLCLAVPMEVREVFEKEPSLLGFVDNLVVPFLYGYRYWETHGVMPFGERAHGNTGVLDYYHDIFHPINDLALIKGLYGICKHGYRGHHPCPCGHGEIIRRCHKSEVLKFATIAKNNEMFHDVCRIFQELKSRVP